MGRYIFPKLSFVCIGMTLIIAMDAFSQPKYEKEIRIRSKDVPDNALRFVESLNLTSVIRWYKEINYEKITFEAKTTFQKERISIEFHEDGSLQDIEIEIPYEKIPNDALTDIHKYLSSKYRKFKIEKAQIQYIGNESVILDFFRNNRKKNANIETRYELVVVLLADGKYQKSEYLFSHNGEFIRTRPIIERKTDTIDY